MSAVPAFQRRDAIDAFAVIVMVCLTLSWGLNNIAAKLSNTGYSPIFLAMVRSAGGAALVFLWCRWRGISLFERDGTLLTGLLAGLLFGAEFLLIFVGLDYTSAARSTLFLNTMPFWALLGGHFVLGERVSGRKIAGLVLAFAGVALVLSDGLSRPGPHALAGDLMSLGAGLAWALTLMVIRGTGLSRAGPEKLLLYQLSVAAVTAAMLLPFFGPAIRDANPIATGALVFQTVYIVAVTYLVWFWLIRRYPVSGLTSFTLLTPVAGVLFAGLILGEPLGVSILAALVLIVGGLWLVNRSPRPKNPAER